MAHRNLANTLGLSLVHTDRTSKKLRDQGLVPVAKDFVRMNDVQVLIKLSDFNPEHL